MANAHFKHLTGPADLVTTELGYCAAWAVWAREFERKSQPFLAEAKALKFALADDHGDCDLFGSECLHGAIAVASGLTRGAVQATTRWPAARFPEMTRGNRGRSSRKFQEEFLGRFLLSRGDTLGGSMRNVGGFLAQCKLTRAIIAHLTLAGKNCQWLASDATAWAPLPKDTTDLELHLKALSWQVRDSPRTLSYNLKVPLVRNNVDLCLFNVAPEGLGLQTFGSAAAYLALGELKGGIDPAGRMNIGKPPPAPCAASAPLLPNTASNPRPSSSARPLRRKWQPRFGICCTAIKSRTPPT